jgi:hypothetical protein
MLWTGLAIAPFVWLLSLEANFALAPLACSHHEKGMLYLVSAIAFILALLGAGLSWRQYSMLREPAARQIPALTRKQSMAIAGVGLSALFALVILAQSIPNLMMAGCE